MTNDRCDIEEKWPKGNIYVNHWASPTYMLSVEDTEMEGGGIELKNKIWDAAKPVVEAWTGMELKPTSQYGIRVYTEGAVLNPHADRCKYCQ
jgi:prolyl 4-hydroxylase